MMPGNYRRVLFDPENEKKVLALIKHWERSRYLYDILNKFRFLRANYRAKQPLKDFPEQLKVHKATAVEICRSLLNHFEYASWPNYLNKIIEHVQEIIEFTDGPGTVGSLSSDGNDTATKYPGISGRNWLEKETLRRSPGCFVAALAL